jgi:hypothetical protein
MILLVAERSLVIPLPQSTQSNLVSHSSSSSQLPLIEASSAASESVTSAPSRNAVSPGPQTGNGNGNAGEGSDAFGAASGSSQQQQQLSSSSNPVELVSQKIVLVGYQCYIVEQW